MSNRTGVFAQLSWPWRGLGAVVLGALLARWGWILFAPHATVAALAPEHATAATGHLFGVVAAGSAPTGGAALSNVRLLGVFTGPHGFAVLMLDGKHQAGFALGEEVAPGTRLVEISKDSIILERAGTRQKVELEGLANALASAKAAVVSGVGVHGSKT